MHVLNSLELFLPRTFIQMKLCNMFFINLFFISSFFETYNLVLGFFFLVYHFYFMGAFFSSPFPFSCLFSFFFFFGLHL